MFNALFRLIASQPQMLADHAEAYADLVAQEVQAASARWRRRLMLGVLALAAFGVMLVLIGVSVMLWAVTPDGAMRAPWALVIVPAVPAVVALGCGLALSSDAKGNGFQTLREQFAADLAMLREASAS